ncbi:MAG: hypothetical protein NVS3B14_03980 [Ktedonobacteraceae bacterium]
MSQTDPTQPQWRQPSVQIQTEWRQTPSQLLPPQYPTHQPIYQQPAPHPSKKLRIGLWISTGVVFVLLIISAIAAGWYGSSQPATSPTSSASSGKQQKSTQAVKEPTQATTTPTSQPTVVSKSVGKPVVVDSAWTVTVNSVNTNKGDQFSTPEAGNTYLVVAVTIKNTSSSNQSMLSALQFNLKDSRGQQYAETITDFATPPDMPTTPGKLVRGQLAFEIPATEHTFFFSFQSEISSSDLTEWILNI